MKNPLKIRLVKGPDGLMHFDPSGKAFGEAVEVESCSDALFSAYPDQAERLLGQVKTGLHKRLIQSLHLAKKAGCLSLGFEKSQKAVEKGEARLLILATDAGADAKKRVFALPKGGYRLVEWGQNAQLASIFNVAACSIVCVKAGRVTDNVTEIMKKIEAFSM